MSPTAGPNQPISLPFIAAWLVAGTLGILLWSPLLDRSIVLSFTLVAFFTNLVLLTGWRALFVFAENRSARG